MEILFNLVWTGVTAALFWFWVAERRQGRGGDLLPALGVQLVALALLAVILLPAISLTDDLQQCTAPAETEHFCRRNEVQASPDQPLHPLPLALALLAEAMHLPDQKSAGHRTADEAPAPDVPGYSRALKIRPPPAAS